MTITTKLNKNESAFIMDKNLVTEVTILSINIKIHTDTDSLITDRIDISYCIKETNVSYDEDYIFKTKQELLDSL